MLLYALVLVFLLLAMVFTTRSSPTGVVSQYNFSANPEFAAGAEPDLSESGPTLDREDNLARLREKISAGQGLISQGEPVLTSVDTPTSSPTDGNNQDIDNPADTEPTRVEKFCAAVDQESKLLSDWDKTKVRFAEELTTRTVFRTVTKTITNGSSTSQTTVEEKFLELPTKPFRGLSSHCLDSTVIGVALDGSLIKNSDTWKFRNYSAGNLIGYARDGLAIYGGGVDEARLDSCGGYDDGTAYRYHLREKELFVLGCFAAQPQTMSK